MQWTEPAGKLPMIESRRGAGSATDRHYVMRHDTDPSLEGDPPAAGRRVNFIDGASLRSRLIFAIVFLGAFVPLYLMLFAPDETKKLPLWQQWLCVAVFTPMGLIGEYLVFTARRPSPAKR